jgi:hypothetical protein
VVLLFFLPRVRFCQFTEKLEDLSNLSFP